MEDDPPSSHVVLSISREGGMRLDLALLEIDSLLLHEETIPPIVSSLSKSLEKEGFLRDPVIVDHESLVVLDGMHRVTVLRRLGCKLVPVCLVDYDSPEIKVERWCRTVKNEELSEELTKRISSKGFKVEEMPVEEANRRLGVEGVVGILKTRGGNYAIISDRGTDVLFSFRVIGEVEENLRSKGFKVEYETELDAEEKLRKREVDAMILPPKIHKKEVKETALRGEVFTYKATRHIIPARPLGIDIPLSLLRAENLSIEEAQEAFSNILKERKFRRIPPGSLWKGRRYDEELYVFE